MKKLMNKPILSLKIPMNSIISEANNSDHWSKKRKRRILHDKIIRWFWIKEKSKITLPCKIKLIRIGRRMDEDNLLTALKGIRDTVADLILPGMAKGRADGDPRLEWIYEQEKGTHNFRIGLRIEIYKKEKVDELS